MQKVIKHTISPPHTSSLKTWKGALIISSDIIGGIIILWLLVETDHIDFEERHFILAETDRHIEVPEGKHLSFIGTYQTVTNHVIHLFELIDF